MDLIEASCSLLLVDNTILTCVVTNTEHCHCRFTELYVQELEDEADLKVLASEYLKGLSLTADQTDGIVKFYLNIKNLAVKKLTDGTGHRPHYRYKIYKIL